MATLPAAIIFVNEDLTDFARSKLIAQLYINDTMTLTEFNLRMTADPNYATVVRLQGLRILVTADFNDQTNRSQADVVIFVKNGLAGIETNKFGSPGLTLPVIDLYIYRLLNNS